MAPTVLRFDELTEELQASAGGKGGTLARLRQAGYPVAEGFVILPAAFQQEELRADAWSEVERQLERIRGNQDVRFAVRSSALGEDSAVASFAGEFESVLNVDTNEAIRRVVHAVRRSRHSERVQRYAQAKGLKAVGEMAVIVQQMVPADLSGILFTADPVSGSKAVMTGSFVRGLGDALVSGRTTGESFYIQRPSGKYEGPTELKPHARRLRRLARRLEADLGCPQDIEWAVAGGKLFVLQSRPITTLIGYHPATGAWNDSLMGDYLWTNVNFGEAVTGVMTPLSWSVLRFIFGEWRVLPGHHTVGNIAGRPYLNISVFASVFDALGKDRRQLLKAMEGTLYMRLSDEVEIPLIPLPRTALLKILPVLAATRLRERRAVAGLPEYLATNADRCRRMRQQIWDAETCAELASLWTDVVRPHVTRSLWYVMGTVSAYSDCATRVRRELATLAGPDDADALLSLRDDGSAVLASMGPLTGLAAVAKGEMDRVEYLERYGHRGPHEFELSVPRPAEEPEWVDHQLMQLRESSMDLESVLARRRQKADDAWERFERNHPKKTRAMTRRIREVRVRAQRREAARSEYTRDRWTIRAFALRAGELIGVSDGVFFLTLEEVLDALSGNDAALHRVDARRDTHARYRSLPSYPPIIRGRFDPFLWAEDPDRRTDLFDSHGPIPLLASVKAQAGPIIGAAGSAGRVAGRVRRLDCPDEGGQLQTGEVLVTAQTDIAWTLLFPSVAAIVTDVGAPLSHAAIVARELGIPAVVGCGDATRRLKSGDQVTVDGGRGVVEVVQAVAGEP